jgi:hypothetical protein
MAIEKRVPTDAEILAKIPAAIAAARKADHGEPRAAAASYDRRTGRVRLDAGDRQAGEAWQCPHAPDARLIGTRRHGTADPNRACQSARFALPRHGAGRVT